MSFSQILRLISLGDEVVRLVNRIIDLIESDDDESDCELERIAQERRIARHKAAGEAAHKASKLAGTNSDRRTR